ncbi:cell division initiation protein [Streptomyces sp. NPDC000594]|uniref:ATP synthase F0 subunit B n=1 Tax=Streptomyces sp. NPDC000594 TaxID=3154261 RepID=UPI003316B8B1
MDVQKKLDEIVRAVGGARSMPMSASCVVNRAELLAMLEEVRAALPGSLAQAREVIGDREQLVAEAHREAQRIIETAHAERGSLVSSTQVARRSQDEADRILAEARREAEEIRAEADDYVDSKLANFEVVLTKTIGSVDRGREKLLGRGPGTGGEPSPGDGGAPGRSADPDVPEHSADPQTLIHRADGYVDAKLGAFEAVLSKTLEAVGRGRLKLQGRTTGDALGEHLAAQDAAGTARRHTSDAEYLAGLAELAEPEGRPAARTAPSAPPVPVPDVPDVSDVPDRAPVYEPVPEQPSYAPAAEYSPYPPQTPVDGRADGYPDAYGQGQPQEWPPYPQDPYPQDVYLQDPYAGYPQQTPQHAPHQVQQQGYPEQVEPYAAQGGYGYPDDPGTVVPPRAAPQQGAALDETSFFDTGMIDLEQLRRYEQGR